MRLARALSIEIRDRAAQVTEALAAAPRPARRSGGPRRHRRRADARRGGARRTRRPLRASIAREIGRASRSCADDRGGGAVSRHRQDRHADALTTKPSPLTRGETAIMRQHAEIGADMLDVDAHACRRRDPRPRVARMVRRRRLSATARRAIPIGSRHHRGSRRLRRDDAGSRVSQPRSRRRMRYPNSSLQPRAIRSRRSSRCSSRSSAGIPAVARVQRPSPSGIPSSHKRTLLHLRTTFRCVKRIAI